MKGYGYIFAAAALWGLIGPFAKLAFQEGIAPLEVAFWRAVLAWLCFGSQAMWQRQVRVAVADLPALGLFSLTGVFLFYGSYQLAVQKGGAALASVLLYTAPAWVALMAGFFFKEKMTRIKIVALAATLMGVALVSLGPGGAIGGASGQVAAAVFFGLVAGFCYSLYYIFGKYFGAKYSAATVFFYILPMGAACLHPLGFLCAQILDRLVGAGLAGGVFHLRGLPLLLRRPETSRGGAGGHCRHAGTGGGCRGGLLLVGGVFFAGGIYRQRIDLNSGHFNGQRPFRRGTRERKA